MCKIIKICFLSHYLRMYQLLKCVRMDELVDQLKLLIRKLRMYSTEAPYELITDRGCTMNVYNSIWEEGFSPSTSLSKESKNQSGLACFSCHKTLTGSKLAERDRIVMCNSWLRNPFFTQLWSQQNSLCHTAHTSLLHAKCYRSINGLLKQQKMTTKNFKIFPA